MTSQDNDEIYHKLQKHLDSMPIGFPSTESGVDIKILKYLFTEEEAEVALRLGIIPQKTKKIYRYFRRKGREFDEIQQLLDNMLKKGVINGGTGRDGDTMYYSIAFLVIGMYEYQVNKMTKEFAELMQQYIDEAFMDEILKKTTPQLRTIPAKKSIKTIEIDESVEHQNIVAPFDDVDELLKNASDTISVAECVCRQEKDIVGAGCDHSKEVCLQFGGAAHLYVDNGWARMISKDEAREILKNAQEEGLVIQPTTTQKPTAICCCCGCSCGVLSNAKKLDKPAQYFFTNYYAEIDAEDCIGCGTCVDRCHMDAISLNDEDIAEIDLDRCIGCGVCVPSCPQETIHLVKKPEVKTPPKNMLHLYQLIGKQKAMQKK